MLILIKLEVFNGVLQNTIIYYASHSFRHTYSTELLLMGVDPTHARKLTGHQSEKAFRRYTLRGEQEAAITSLSSVNAAYYRAVGEESEDRT
nr:tyrosine-type recombinase/integrase [Chroococcidiopsis cubana]